MPRIVITGSTDGLGLMAAELPLKRGHRVTVHACNEARAAQVLAPYLLTALITGQQRLVYLSSGMHIGGDAALDDPQWKSAAGTARKRMPRASSMTSC